MQVELLIFDGCPNANGAERMLRDTIRELNAAADIEIVKVLNIDDAVAKRFLGSPSIRINGKDLEIEENEFTQYSMRCRVYRNGNEQSGLPSRRLLVKAIESVSR